MEFISKNNKKIFVPAETEEHMAAHTDVMAKDIAEACKRVVLDETISTFFMGSVELDYICGKDNCVPITEENKNKVRFTIRSNREGATPVINCEGVDTTFITVGICYEDNMWQLFTAFYGIKAPREPWDKNIKSEEERQASAEFWKTHALAVC